MSKFGKNKIVITDSVRNVLTLLRGRGWIPPLPLAMHKHPAPSRVKQYFGGASIFDTVKREIMIASN